MFYFISKSFFCKPIVSHLNIHIPLTTVGKNCSFIFCTCILSYILYLFLRKKKIWKSILSFFIPYYISYFIQISRKTFIHFLCNIRTDMLSYILHLFVRKKISETYSFIFYTILHIISILCLFLEKYHYYKCICEYLRYIFDVSLWEHLLHIYLSYLSSNF